MYNRTWKKPLTIGVIMIIAVWVNDLFVALVRWEGCGAGGYAIHLAAFAGIVACIIFLQQRLAAATHRLELFRRAFRGVPCALLVAREGVIEELYGSDELLEVAGLTVGSQHRPAREAVKVEELSLRDGAARVVERRVVSLTDYGAGHAAEFLYEITGCVRRAWTREGQYVRMLKILVNMFEMKDPYSNGHSDAVSNLAHDLARAMGLTARAVATVTRAALLHDIGKIVIPAEILTKDGPLTPEERRPVQAHAAVGADILASFEIFREEADVVRHHHERYDGAGYPGGLRGEAIPLGARILAVADAFDAMTSGRSARGRRDAAAALAVIEAEKGGQFDPAVAEAFVELVRAGRAGKGQGKEMR
ncbi:HD-GYP domain-containing protein [Anaeroselena agilis]|uniref:HD domain-containing protein n=1 Tax=Anaeroselena agilis TaxID=3063788 RepID=A0ABU3NYX9_9FIRM|nr:HD domain-containing protein [Selenomonadales bacterium 4137-cl]